MTQDLYKTLIEPPDNGDLSNPGQSITQKTNSAKSQISSSQSLIKKPSHTHPRTSKSLNAHTLKHIRTDKSKPRNLSQKQTLDSRTRDLTNSYPQEPTNPTPEISTLKTKTKKKTTTNEKFFFSNVRNLDLG